MVAYLFRSLVVEWASSPSLRVLTDCRSSCPCLRRWVDCAADSGAAGAAGHRPSGACRHRPCGACHHHSLPQQPGRVTDKVELCRLGDVMVGGRVGDSCNHGDLCCCLATWRGCFATGNVESRLPMITDKRHL